MNYASRRDLTKALEERLGNRCKPQGKHAGPLATVLPADVEEVRFLADSVRRYSARLSPAGAGTDPDFPEPTGETVLLRTEMMRKIRFPDSERGHVEVEPGVLWVDLEDELRSSHRALTVYPTSAPRATVGGWIARDGMGVGSFTYGWLRENIISAEVVLPEGRLRTLEGDDLGLVVGAMGRTGVIVSATLKLRDTKGDRPFAISFARQEALQRAVDSLLKRRPPLWHLGIVNPPMSRAMRSREGYLIFGAYPASEAATAEGELARVSRENRSTALDAAEAYRMWGARFFPVTPARPTPAPGRVLVPASRVGAVLDQLRSGPSDLAVLGSVGRDGSALLLAFASYGEEDRPRSLSAGDESALVRIARSVGGDLYHAVLKQRAKLAP
jgi:glycolate oxidase